MKNYSKTVTNQPQSRPIFGRTDMTQNNAGGFVFTITEQQRLERFLLIGSEGGTYYVDERELTEQNAQNVVNMIKKDGLNVVKTVLNFAVGNRAPKADAGIFVLALCTTYGNEDTKAAAYAAISTVCNYSTKLFLFLSNIQNLRGWSSGLRKGVAKFYTNLTEDKLAYQLVKYRNRAGFTHADALRLSHPKANSDLKNALYRYAVGKTPESEVNQPLVQAYGKAQNAKGKELLGLIGEGKLTWEMVPTGALNDAAVLTALLPNMPLTALMRNLNRFSYNDMTKGVTVTTKAIVAKLTNPDFVAKSGVHPINVINSMLTYAAGRGIRGDKTWDVNQNIVDALADTYELAVKALTPTGKSILIGVDVSGSMSSPAANMQMSCAQVANVLALTVLKTEKNAELVWFDTGIVPAKIGRRNSVDDAVRMAPHGGGTDCAQPLIYAANTLNKYDAVIIFTDSETWAGSQHAYNVLNSYRRTVNQNVKVIEIALAPNASSVMPGDDPNILRIVGFDSSVTEIINEYLK